LIDKGLTESDAAVLNDVAGVVDQVKELDWNKSVNILLLISI